MWNKRRSKVHIYESGKRNVYESQLFPVIGSRWVVSGKTVAEGRLIQRLPDPPGERDVVTFHLRGDGAVSAFMSRDIELCSVNIRSPLHANYTYTDAKKTTAWTPYVTRPLCPILAQRNCFS